MRILSRIALIVLCLAVLAVPTAHAARSRRVLRLQPAGRQCLPSQRPALNGWEAEGGFSFIPLLGLDVDVAHYGLGAASTLPHSTTAMIGPRLTVGASGVHVYAHALLGGEHSSNSGNVISSSALTVAVGGGVDLRIFIPLLGA